MQLCSVCLAAEAEQLRQKARLQSETERRVKELECINAGLQRELQEKVSSQSHQL